MVPKVSRALRCLAILASKPYGEFWDTTRSKLRAAVKVLNRIFTKLRVEKGFDFLGYQVSPEGFTASAATKARLSERAKQLYEQEKKGEENISSPLRVMWK